MEEREFDIFEVKQALNNAEEILKMIPDALEHSLGCGMRREEPDHQHYLLLLLAIEGLIPRLRQADEFLYSILPLDAENKKQLEALIEEQKQEQKSKKPNLH